MTRTESINFTYLRFIIFKSISEMNYIFFIQTIVIVCRRVKSWSENGKIAFKKSANQCFQLCDSDLEEMQNEKQERRARIRNKAFLNHSKSKIHALYSNALTIRHQHRLNDENWHLWQWRRFFMPVYGVCACVCVYKI